MNPGLGTYADPWDDADRKLELAAELLVLARDGVIEWQVDAGGVVRIAAAGASPVTGEEALTLRVMIGIAPSGAFVMAGMDIVSCCAYPGRALRAVVERAFGLPAVVVARRADGDIQSYGSSEYRRVVAAYEVDETTWPVMRLRFTSKAGDYLSIDGIGRAA